MGDLSCENFEKLVHLNCEILSSLYVKNDKVISEKN